MSKKEIITRREFLKLTSVTAASVFLTTFKHTLPEGPLERGARHEIINPLIDAVKVPTIEYHDPDFKAVDACMTPEVFLSQLDWIKEAGYFTPNAERTSKFLDGEKTLPNPSVILRFDLGVDKIDEEKGQSVWIDVFEALKQRNLHALIFLIPDTIGSKKMGLKWEDIAKYVKDGVISPCSHGLPNHPDYRHLDKEEAIYEMRTSRERILANLQKAGVNSRVLGFAFPYDAVPKEAKKLTKEAGYSFFANSTRKNGQNAAEFGKSSIGLVNLYPYVYRKQIEEVEKYSSIYFPPLLTIKGGLSFPDTLIRNGNDIFLNSFWKRFEKKFAEKIKLLPESDMTTGRLINPQIIVVHTDSQHLETYKRWSTDGTYNGLNGARRKIYTAFGVDRNGPEQFVHVYKRNGRLWILEPGNDHEGASGMSSAINIEMAGIQFDEILRNDDSEKKEIVMSTLENTANLIIKLIKSSGGKLNFKDVVGHYEVTVRGKSDPGKETMKILRSIIQKKLQEN